MKLQKYITLSSLLCGLFLTACNSGGTISTTTANTSAINSAAASVSKAAEQYQYSVIIDAGSSGSRLHLFQFNKDNSTIDVKDIKSFKVTPGISSYASNPSAAGQSIQSLVDQLTKYLNDNNIQHDNQHKIKLSVMATAGMRILPLEQQTNIYNNIQETLSGNQNNSYLDVAYVGTITGQDEGLYGWLDVNYLSGNLNNCNSNTAGSLDMGGASTQIAFDTHNMSNFTAPTINFTLKNCQYKVFSQSFLGLGQDQALASMNKLEDKNSCYAPGYQSSDNIIQGNFNYNKCYNNYHSITAQEQFKDSLKQISILEKSQQFISFSGSYYTFSFLGITNNINQSSLTSAIQEKCYKSYSDLEKLYPSDAFLNNYCANAEHLNNLFYDTNNYNLGNNSIVTASAINGTGLDWTLGAQTYQLYAK